MSDPIQNILSHYGTKGMKWGVRKRFSVSTEPSDVSVATKQPGNKLIVKGGKNQPPSEDAINAAVSKQRAQKSGTQALTNAELQALVNRLNLEQQYSRLAPNPGSAGKQFADQLLEGPLPSLAQAGAKSFFKDSKDPRVRVGLAVSEAFVQGTKSGKKKK